ncbi:Gp15 family bacteriophage protein [Sutcliffiella sp. NC1]|uniref:Gp15 family bacteriophage protein n=1 Tax=Sutcliffiella sp. NC1 TaxID=3004096 RepID=UPI0022DE0E0E|nr:Gp15 family bacteriophage protein [Sutcliffiella sp. NC1]WBL16451.1 Gp15 family bacteriophage protein [Sutcliffiella sp. NC1]
MFTLSDRLEEEIEIEGDYYPINLFFDVVLRFFDLMDDEEFFDSDKIEIAFKMLVGTEKDFEFETKYKAVQAIVTSLIIGVENKQKKSPGESSDKKIYYDLKQDAEYIYASFMQEYGIDLIDQQGSLRWEKFKALLSGMRDTTKFKEIVGIRAAKLPTGKGTEEERKRLKELKEMYALNKDQKSREEELDYMFNKLAGGN